MVLDAKYRHIFILGRYLEKGLREESRNVKVKKLRDEIINLRRISISKEN